jgi:hypothetical protein
LFVYLVGCLFVDQVEERELQKDMITQLVRAQENFPENAYRRVLLYKDTILRPLEVSVLRPEEDTPKMAANF